MYAGRLKQNANGRFLIVSHIDNDKIRIISAREMTADVKHYVVDTADVISLQLKKGSPISGDLLSADIHYLRLQYAPDQPTYSPRRYKILGKR